MQRSSHTENPESHHRQPRGQQREWKSHTMNLLEDTVTPGTLPHFIVSGVVMKYAVRHNWKVMALSALYSHMTKNRSK